MKWRCSEQTCDRAKPCPSGAEPRSWAAFALCASPGAAVGVQYEAAGVQYKAAGGQYKAVEFNGRLGQGSE